MIFAKEVLSWSSSIYSTSVFMDIGRLGVTTFNTKRENTMFSLDDNRCAVCDAADGSGGYCQFKYFSFIVTLDGRIFVGDTQTPEGVAEGWKIESEPYCEAMWTGEDPNSLMVFGENSDKCESFILNKFKTRSELMKAVTIGKVYSSVYKLKDGLVHCDNGPAVESATGDVEYFTNGKRNRADGPAFVTSYGHIEYWVDGKCHNPNGPAVIGSDGTIEYWIDNKLHNLTGPAVIGPNGKITEYWVDGKRHNPNGPAIICSNGHVEYWVNDELHNPNGPAIERSNGSKEWWVDGKRTRKDGPAIVGPDGIEEYWFDGKRDRKDGPAVVFSDGSGLYFVDGKMAPSVIGRGNPPTMADNAWYYRGEYHHEDGPAVECVGAPEWFNTNN